MNTQQIYEKITGIIIEMLENHKKNNYSESWVSLSGDSIFARNAVSKRYYRGINQLLLNYTKSKYGYVYNSWMTFKQLSALNGKIKKGSKASMIVYTSFIYVDRKTKKNITKLVEGLLKKEQSIDHLDYEKIGFLKKYNVFNLSQIEDLPGEYYQLNNLEDLTEFEKDERAEFIINSTGANIEYALKNSAYYIDETDTIHLPERKQFVSKQGFYNTAFHELAHWTGTENRLNRPKGYIFGSKDYAFEELIAEISAAFLCAYLGYQTTITNNVAYIDSWLSVMKNDTQFVVSASSQAQKASDFILQFSNVEQFETV